MAIERILQEFAGTPDAPRVWAIQPEVLEHHAGILAAKANSGQIPEANEIEAAHRRQRERVTRANATAVIPVFGTICNRMGALDAMSGGLSLETFAESFRDVLADDDVGQIVLRFDSPGGSVSGVMEAAEMIAGATSEKRVISVIDPQAGSAAYWLAVQASEVIATPSGQAGSIGCYTVHFDHSEQLAEEGIKVTVIKAGTNKAEGNPYEPLSEDAVAHIQSLVDFYDTAFVEAVARGRGVTADTVRESFGQGRMFEAPRLVRLGMADRVASFDNVLAELKSGSGRSRVSVAAISDTDRISAFVEAVEHPIAIQNHIGDAVRALTSSHTGAAQGNAATDSILIPTEPAPEATEEPMSDKDTAAPKGLSAEERANALEEARAEERQRVREIKGIGRAHGVEQAKVDEWVDKGLTVDEVNAAVLETLRGKTATAPRVSTTVAEIHDRVEDDPRFGFESHRDFLLAAMKNAGYADRGLVRDERLRPLAVRDSNDPAAGGELSFMLPRAFTPLGFSAAAGSDEQGGYADRYGGFAVPTTTLPGLLQLGPEADPSAGRTQSIPMASPQVDIVARTDKDHSSSVAGGLTVSRRAETAAGSSSRAEIEKVSLRAHSLFGMAFATEEILSDSAVSFTALIANGFRDQFAVHMLDEKIRGGGAGEYLGVLNSPALVSVAKEGSQAADTIQAENVINMRARCWGYGNAIWIANHDAYPQLIKMAVVVEGSVGGGLVLIYQPSLREDRPDTLLGRPIFYSEYASTLGDQGDIMLVNWSQYLEGLYQPLMSAESIHVRFVNHERAFKFWLRNAGAPWWRSALTPNKSSSTLSPMVTLDERA